MRVFKRTVNIDGFKLCLLKSEASDSLTILVKEKPIHRVAQGEVGKIEVVDETHKPTVTKFKHTVLTIKKNKV